VIVSSQLVGRLYHRVGPRRLIFWGMVAMAAVTMLLGVIGLHTDLWWIRLIMFGRGVCMAFAFVPLQAATYANITPEDTGRASAIYSTQRQVAAALGVGALLTVLLSGAKTVAGPALSAYQTTFLVGAVLVVLAAITALLIRDEDAASTREGHQASAPDAQVAVAGD
jgi:predicted MFS family arabinose efflux permease